jgi:serine/threonine protein kinase/WD40 repeat protein
MADRDLILGVLATQAGFATAAQIMEAAAAGLVERDGQSLLARLETSGAITAEQRAVLEGLADAALEGSDGKVHQSPPGVRTVSLTPAAEVAAASTLPASDPDFEGRIPPEREGQYARLGEIGRGGQSVVLKALDRFIGREVAIKELLPRPVENPTPSASPIGARFLREVRLTAQLDHPGIVSVHELAQRPDGTLFCAQKLIPGETLKVHLARSTSLRQRLALLPHLIDACHAIAYAHSRGVIHRDLKPSNVMVGPYGETVVVDWGLAKRRGEVEAGTFAPSPEAARDPGLTVAGVALGTPSYMSPEQARGAIGEIDERSDVFSLGTMLYEMLCGRVPFEGANNEQIIEKALTGAVPPVATVCPPEAPAELAAIAERALERDPDKRYQTADALVKDLLAYRSGERVTAYEYGSWELIRKFVGRHRGLSIASAVALLILAGSGLNTWRQLRQSRRALASSLLERARAAENDSDWGRAAGYYAESRIEQDSREARWGYALARQRMPHRLFARRGADQSVIDVGYLHDGRALALSVEPPFLVGRELDSGKELWRFESTPRSQFTGIEGTGTVKVELGGSQTYLDAGTGELLGAFRSNEATPCPSSPFPPPALRKPEGLVSSGPGEPVMLAPKFSPEGHCVVSPDGQRIAFRDAAGVVHLWDLRERRELATRNAPDASKLLFTAHGLAVVRARAIQVFGGTEGDFVIAIPGRGGNGLMTVGGRGIAVSPDGHLVVTSRLTSNQADVVDLRTRAIVTSFSYPPGTPKFTFSPASDQLLVAGLLHGSVVAGWDLRSQAPAHRVTGSRVMAFQSAQDGTRFEVLHYSFNQSRYEVWNDNGEKLHSGELGRRANATISGDGRRVATSDLGSVEVRDALTGRTFLHVACEECLRVKLSADGAYLLTWSAKRRLDLWDVAQSKSIWSESKRVGGPNEALDVSRDGKRVLWTRDLELFLVGTETGTESQLRLDDAVEDAKLSHDLTRLAVVTKGTIGVWALEGLRPLWRVGNFSSVDQEVYWSGDDSALIVLYDSLGTQLVDSATGTRFANFPVTHPGAFGTQEVVLPSLRYRISRGDGVWEMWPVPAPDDSPPRESLQRVLSEAGLEVRGVDLVDAAPAPRTLGSVPSKR